MNNKIINCKKINETLQNEIKRNKDKKKLVMACLYLCKEQTSLSYLTQIKKEAKELNVQILEYPFQNDIDEKKIINTIDDLNTNTDVQGILFINPRNSKYNYEKINKNITTHKNVDNLKLPNTVYAILEVLNHVQYKKTDSIVILGRGPLVGTPLFNYLKNNGYKVIQCHSKTKNIKQIVSNADILISAIGRPHSIKKEYIKENAILIDVGTSYKENKIYGDIDIKDVLDKVKYTTQTPGGIGILTTTYLFKNLIEKNKKPSNH